MIPILYDTIVEGTVPSDFGLGCLTDAIECTVEEGRNSVYELKLIYAAQGIHAEDIQPDRIIKAQPNYIDAPQLFRIYKVGKALNGRVEINARHISYDLSGKVITAGSAGSAVAACALLETEAGAFTISTDKTVSASFNISEPSSVRSWFGGKQGSILDVYGPGEWQYNNFAASFKTNRGQDRGVTIRYGKNLTELSQTLDLSNLVSSVIPFYKAQDGTITTGAAVPTGLTGIDRELAVNFSSSVDPESATPIVTQLATLASSYISNNNLTVIKNSITLDFVQLEGLTERVDLCDTVHIYFEPLGITATAKCIETVWDVLKERYTSTTFGDPKTNIVDTITTAQKEIEEKPSTSAMDQAIKQATELITGNLGGYVVLHDANGDGEPDEILIMDTADIATATSVWRWNSGGLGFSPNGYAGPYNAVAIDMQGRISASSVTTGVLDADLIKAGVISDVQGNSSIDMTSGEAKMKNFKAIENFQLIDANDLVRAVLQFSNVNGATFDIQNSSGNTIAALQEDFVEGGQLFLNAIGGDERVWLGAGQNGGILRLKDFNTTKSVTLYNTEDGTGGLQLWDSSGDNIIVHCLGDANDNGRVEVLHPTLGYMAVMRSASNGGVIDVYDTNYLQIQLIGNGGVVRCVTVQQTSSRKVKENIKPIEDAKKVLELNAVSFDYKNKALGTNKRGFIAEDVAKVLPNLVTPEAEDMPAGLDYVGLIPYLQAVIKDQEKRIQALEKKVNGQ